MGEMLPTVDLGDKRLNKRCNQLIDQFASKPSTSIPEACHDWKNTKAAYRFFTNEMVEPDQILTAHYEQTQQRIKETQGIILVAQDTTDLDYTTHKKLKGIGYLQGEHIFGIKVHSALAMSEQGTPVGLLSQKRWIRKVEEFGKRHNPKKWANSPKESERWITTFQEVGKRVTQNRKVVVIGDRESDFYDLFALKRRENLHLLVRAKHNRYLWGIHKRLFEKVLGSIPAGTLTISMQKTPKRPPREATLTVRFTQVTLTSRKGKGAIRLWAVSAEEEKPPGDEKPIKWLLLTTVPVNSFEIAVTIINWYTKRWLIERFHYCLKSGCKIEELQLQEKTRLERAVAVYSIVAWKLLWITYEAREHPGGSYESILTPEEWQVLCLVTKIKGKTKVKETIQNAVKMLAKLGGFLGRKGDKQPGVKTLWIGIRRFNDIMYGWNVSNQKDMGKG